MIQKQRNRQLCLNSKWVSYFTSGSFTNPLFHFLKQDPYVLEPDFTSLYIQQFVNNLESVRDSNWFQKLACQDTDTILFPFLVDEVRHLINNTMDFVFSFFFFCAGGRPTPLKLYILYIYCCRVQEILRRDAQKDPETFPDAMYAKKLIDQVCCQLEISEH